MATPPKKRKIYRIESPVNPEEYDPANPQKPIRWYEVCARQTTIDLAAVKVWRYEKKGLIIRVVEQDA